METTVHYLGGVKFEVGAGSHRVLCDQPAANGGEDAGLSPPAFLLASLGTCAAFYALQYLRTRALPAEGLSVKVHAAKAHQPARLASFRIEVDIPQELDDRHKEGVLRAVKSCLIHNTLLQPPAIQTVIETGVHAHV